MRSFLGCRLDIKSCRHVLRITLIYLVIAALYIWLSDKALAAFVTDKLLLARLQTAKDWIFVLITAFIIYVLVGRSLRTLERSERVLRESQEHLSWVLENALDILAILDSEVKVLYVSASIERILGYKVEEMLGRHLLDLVHPDDYNKTCTEFQQLDWTEGMTASSEFRIHHKDGSWIVVEMITRRGTLGTDTPVYVTNIRDITERNQAKQALADSQRRLSDIITFLPDATFAIDLEGKVIAWNRAMEELSGVKAEEILGKAGYEYSLPFYGVRRPALIDLVLHADPETEKFYTKVSSVDHTLTAESASMLLRPGGVYYWIKAAPLYDSSGNIVGAIESVRDITERKKSMDELRTQKELLQSVMDNVPQAVYWKDTNLKFIGCNKNFAEDAGVGDPSNILGKMEEDMVWTKEEAELYAQSDLHVMQNNKPSLHIVEPQHQVGGNLAWIESNRVPLHDDQGNVVGVLGTYEDVTEQRRIQEELRERRQRERQIQAEAEEAKRQFYRGTIFSVTDGKLNLVSYEELEDMMECSAIELNLVEENDLSRLRNLCKIIAKQEGMPEDRSTALVMAVGEAAANAIKHAKGGTAKICVVEGCVQVSIQDSGPGMDTLVLPKATLMSRFSTKPSMGLGYSIILDSVDTVYLATGKEGTWVLMRQAVKAPVQEICLEAFPDTW